VSEILQGVIAGAGLALAGVVVGFWGFWLGCRR